MNESKSIGKRIYNGLIPENPVLRLMLGTCPALAVTTTASSAIGMGIAATIVLICSNCVISLLRKFIPDKVRIPAYITIIAGFVTLVQMLIKAYAPTIDEQLGIYLPLITVNCIILGRAEAYASKHPVSASLVDGLAMGIGFSAAIFLMGCIRELLGQGTLFGMALTAGVIPPMVIFVLPPGGFFVFGILIALTNRLAEKRGKPKVEHTGCHGCPSASLCGHMEDNTACQEGK